MGKRNKKLKSDKNVTDKQTAFNPKFLLWLFGFVFALWGNFYLLFKEHAFSWFLMLILLMFTVMLFLDSVFYIFTKNEIYFVHFFGYKKRLPWLYVCSILKYGFLSIIDSHKMSGYEIFYDQPYKGRVIRKFTYLALTPKVKKCLHKFYRGEIIFESKRKSKKSKK